MKGERKAKALFKQGLSIGAIKELWTANQPKMLLKEAKDVVDSWKRKKK